MTVWHRQRTVSAAGSAVRRRWLSLLLVGILALCGAVVGALSLTQVAQAAPGETVAQRDRDEDVRVERFLPPAAALAGIVGVIIARRLQLYPLASGIRFGAPLLALALAIWPLVSIGPRPLNRQPSPDAQEYADAARHLAAGEGYVTTIYRNEVRPPRYPPGFSLALAPFGLAGRYPANVQLGSRVYAVLYLVATLGVAWAVGGPLAAAVAVALVGASPFAVRYASLVMSDAFAAGLTVLVLPLLHRPTTARLGGAGLLAGSLILVRLSGVVTLAAIVATLFTRRRWRGLVVAGTGAALGVAALGFQQWNSFGSPLMTGYAYWLPDLRTFGLDFPLALASQRDGSGVVADSLDGALLRWTCPCPEDDPLIAFRPVTMYPLVLLGLFWIFTPPLTTIPGLVEVWRRRREPAASYVLWLTGITLGLHLFYFYLAPRFMAGPATLLAVYSGVAVARWAARWEGAAADESPVAAVAVQS
ncbi:MAG: hypothetical protein IT306_26855 [Chloroflexi bacterium]|nr:hypothetical protein [Chloroflexota bacterium]